MAQDQFNFDGLGLNINEVEDNDFTRGFGYNTNTNDNDNTYFENGNDDDSELVGDKAPDMPQEYYHNLDSFLSRAPPKFHSGDGKKSKSSSSSKGKESSVPKFPSIKQRKDKACEAGSTPPLPPPTDDVKLTKGKSQAKSKLGISTSKKAHAIDPKLLSEAFEYTDRLLREAVLEEAQQRSQQPQRELDDRQGSARQSGKQQQQQQGQSMRQVKSAPEVYLSKAQQQQRSGSGGSRKVDGGSGGNMGAVRRLKNSKQQQQQQHSSIAGISSSGKLQAAGSGGGSGFNTTVDGEQDLRKNPVDFDELVANFTSGATLQRLRRELEQSKASMADSQKHLRDLSQDFFK